MVLPAASLLASRTKSFLSKSRLALSLVLTGLGQGTFWKLEKPVQSAVSLLWTAPKVPCLLSSYLPHLGISPLKVMAAGFLASHSIWASSFLSVPSSLISTLLHFKSSCFHLMVVVSDLPSGRVTLLLISFLPMEAAPLMSSFPSRVIFLSSPLPVFSTEKVLKRKLELTLMYWPHL